MSELGQTQDEQATTAGHPIGSVRARVIAPFAAVGYVAVLAPLAFGRWAVALGAFVVVHAALFVVVAKERREGATLAVGAPLVRRRAGVATRADAWLLAEALCDLSTSDAPVPAPGRDDRVAVISRRNKAAVEFFPSVEAANEALDEVTRQHPNLQARFGVSTRSDPAA